MVSARLQELGVPLEQVLTSWVFCIFIDGVPVETLLRISLDARAARSFSASA